MLELCVGDFPELKDGSDCFLESWVVTEAKLDRDASPCSCPWPGWECRNGVDVELLENGLGGPVGPSVLGREMRLVDKGGGGACCDGGPDDAGPGYGKGLSFPRASCMEGRDCRGG